MKCYPRVPYSLFSKLINSKIYKVKSIYLFLQCTGQWEKDNNMILEDYLKKLSNSEVNEIYKKLLFY